MQTIYVKPTKSERLGKTLIVRQPEHEGAPLPEAGAWVPKSAFWVRRLKEGSVIEAKPPRQTSKKGD